MRGGNGSRKRNEFPVVVTTAHKGVFFGYAEFDGGWLDGKDVIRLERARMCVYWSAELKGVLGLASRGPSPQCKIGEPVPAITLGAVTSVMEVTDDAVTCWESAPWS